MSSRDYSRPVRPPRASKNAKETSGYLMKIIQTLSISQDNAERERQKEILEKEFAESDRLFCRLVKASQEDLSKTMQAFSKTSLSLQASIERCQCMKEKLSRCKTLLHCRRDELKRLWLEVVEHKRVMNMLKEIENVMGVHERIETFLKGRMYLDATKLLVSSILLFEGSLDDIDALKELKTELYEKREELHNILVKELHLLLYLSASSYILKRFKRHGSGRLRHDAISARLKTASRDMNSCAPMSTVMWSHSFTWAEDNNYSEIEASTQSSISNIVHCVSLLHRVPETIEVLKEKCQQELLAIVRRTAQHVAETCQNVPFTYQHSYLGSAQSKEQQYVLLDLLELIFEQFKCVILNHKSLLKNFQERMAENENGNKCTYELADIWSKVQAVLEIFAGEYVDIQKSHYASHLSPSAPSSFSKLPSAVDISSFFLKKRNQKSKNFSLFKFDSSSHAISMKTYLQEQKDALKEKGEIDAFDSDSNTLVFICPPATKNIITIYQPLSKFVMEITEELNMESGENCPLYTFTSQCVGIFLGQISVEVNDVIEKCVKSLENWRVVSDPESLKKAGVSTYLLHSAVFIDNTAQELQELCYALPLHSAHFLHIICNMLQSYRVSCQTAYTSVVQSPSEDLKRIISSSWAKDKDISRLLRSLPNWTNLKEKDCSDFEESPEEVRLRNKKESEILIANLSGDVLISQQEILLDPGHLHNLALLHESMEWLSSQILAFVNNLPKQPCNQSLPNLNDVEEDDMDPVPDAATDSLMKIANDYGNLADTCLLVLHLEVRVHCFFYLQPLATEGCYAARLDNQEPDPEIIKLNTDLSKIDESLQSVLKPCNIKYIFEGLGELISTILINSTNKIKRVNENGVKKINRNIFALQQNLTGITMFREVALDRARQYFDLLNHTPEEILNLIVENGSQFQELEYSAAFHLLHRSHPGSDSSVLNVYLDRLHQILNEVAVSV